MGLKEHRIIVDLVNKRRVESHLEILRWNDNLYEAALLYSQKMASKQKLEHYDKLGLTAKEKKLRSEFSIRGENIASNFSATESELLVQAWMDSPPHKENILRKEFEEGGVGITAAKNGVRYFTFLFGGKRPVITGLRFYEQKQKGDNWTCNAIGVVKDNIDSPDKIKITVVKKFGAINKIVPEKMPLNPNDNGEFTFSVETSGMEKFGVTVTAVDTRDNESEKYELE